MNYRLREDLSCCDVDGHMIFLDIGRDRYFRLTGSLEEAMRRYFACESVNSALLKELAIAQILVKASDLHARATIGSIRRPSHSAIEQAPTADNRRLGIAVVFEAIATIWTIHRQLSCCAFKAVIEAAAAYRDRQTKLKEAVTTTAFKDSLIYASSQFARARRCVPVEPICLLDSLSLLRFLSRRGLSANIVFGVMPEPFAAHCWVQAGEMVLNETLSGANAYTPIRIV